MIRGLDHVAVAVEDLDEAVAFYRERLGLEPSHREKLAEYGVEIATFQVGGAAVELVAGEEGSAVAGFLRKRGSAIHHLAFAVDSIAAEMERLTRAGLRFLSPAPRPGRAGSQVAFVDPRSTLGVLYELVEKKKKD